MGQELDRYCFAVRDAYNGVLRTPLGFGFSQCSHKFFHNTGTKVCHVRSLLFTFMLSHLIINTI